MTNKIAEGLVAGMRRSVRPGMLKLRNFVQGRPPARKLMAEVKSIESLVAGGSHPLHAAYTRAQNYLSIFSELASAQQEFKDFTAVVSDAEEAYMPGWPPMSPVSVSCFTSWALLDLPVAATGETICSCAVETGRAFGMSVDFASTLETMGRSATGIHQHLGWRDGLVGLRDILDDQVYRCIVPSGYRGTGVVQKVLFPGYTGNRQSRASQGIPRFACNPDLNHARHRTHESRWTRCTG